MILDDTWRCSRQAMSYPHSLLIEFNFMTARSLLIESNFFF
jgi:hypothetical protein